MVDRLTGNVFSVGSGMNTRGMSVDNYMKSMGYGAEQDLVDYSPVEPEEGIQTGVDATEEYYNQLRNLTDMAH